MSISRRGFIRAAGAALPVVALPACVTGDEANAAAQTGAAANRVLDPATLRAVADVVLPSGPGAAVTERAVAGFEAWLAGYRPVAELDHGYGSGEIRYAGPDPAPGWKAQLEAWDLEARERHGVPFSDLDRPARESYIRNQLRAERSLPAPAQAHNVALGLLAWWTSSPEAADLCHGVAIGRETCRPLSALGAAPSPLHGSPS